MKKGAAVVGMREGARIMIVSGCLLSLLLGCSSRMQTGISSKKEPERPKIAEVQPKEPPAEEVVMEPIKAEGVIESSPTEIVAEESPAPVVPQPAEVEIFATPKSEDFSSAPILSQPISPVEPESPALDRQVGVEEIPPVDFAPEMPATPRQNAEPSVEAKSSPLPSQHEPQATEVPSQEPVAVLPSTPEPLVELEPVHMGHETQGGEGPLQVAKIIPPDSDEVVIIERGSCPSVKRCLF